jgi:hypothetical protein
MPAQDIDPREYDAAYYPGAERELIGLLVAELVAVADFLDKRADIADSGCRRTEASKLRARAGDVRRRVRDLTGG